MEAETHRNIEVIWLLRHLKPDFKTIADFRSRNCHAFRQVFRVVLLCRKFDLFGRELLAVDGTRIKAVNNKDRNFTRARWRNSSRSDATLEEYLKRLDEGDLTENGTQGASRTSPRRSRRFAETRERYATLLANLEKSGEDQISLTDPDSRAMAAHTRVAGGYNVQVAVDAKNRLIVEQQVTKHVVDMGLLKETAREILDVEMIDVVADKGYLKIATVFGWWTRLPPVR